MVRSLCIATAASAVLLAAGASLDHAKAQSLTPLPPGYVPPPHAFGAPTPYGPHDEYGLPPLGPGYELPPYAYQPPPGYGPPLQYGPPPPGYVPPSYAYRAPPGH